MNAKDKTVAAVARAKNDLEEALHQLEHLPMFDAGSVGYAAHALDSYLTVIDGTVRLLRVSLHTCGDQEIFRWLDGLRHTTELMTHTVNQLMNSSSGGPTFKLVEVDLAELADRACAYYSNVAARKRIEIQLKSAPETPPVWVDPVALAAVLDNLLSNAVKYSPPGKLVFVEIRCEPDAVVCSVRDEGPGISEADQARLFRKGVRLSAKPTGAEPSTGYGLAVAKDLAKKIGGDLQYESGPEAGACFSVRLPRMPEAPPASAGDQPGSFTIPVRMMGD